MCRHLKFHFLGTFLVLYRNMKSFTPWRGGGHSTQRGVDSAFLRVPMEGLELMSGSSHQTSVQVSTVLSSLERNEHRKRK